jgi:hypothetical protein
METQDKKWGWKVKREIRRVLVGIVNKRWGGTQDKQQRWE